MCSLNYVSPSYLRFVDRDMFMRYRGGGVGHKYMRNIEAKHENMSRERWHGKEPHHKPGPLQADNGVDDVSDSDDDSEDPAVINDEGEGSDRSDRDEGVEGSDGSDEDRAPSETGLSDGAGAGSDSDEITSDLDYDSYGLADP